MRRLQHFTYFLGQKMFNLVLTQNFLIGIFYEFESFVNLYSFILGARIANEVDSVL